MRVPQGHPSERDWRSSLKRARTHTESKLTDEVLDLRGLKFQLAVEVVLQKDAANGTEVLTVPVFRTRQTALLQAYEISQALHEAFPGLPRRLEHYTNEGSGWVVNRLTKLGLDVARYQPLRGGSYLPPSHSGQEQENNYQRQKQGRRLPSLIIKSCAVSTRQGLSTA